jgi:hypothetical protein
VYQTKLLHRVQWIYLWDVETTTEDCCSTFACSSPGTHVTALLAEIVVPSGVPTLPPLLRAIASEAATAVAPAAGVDMVKCSHRAIEHMADVHNAVEQLYKIGRCYVF